MKISNILRFLVVTVLTMPRYKWLKLNRYKHKLKLSGNGLCSVSTETELRIDQKQFKKR